MNKGIILATTLALSMAANAGLQKEGVKIPVDNKPAVVKHVGKNQTAENGVIELQYKSSETQRDENIEKAVINYLNYDKNQDGWNDIIMPVSGGGVKLFYAKMQFDGEKYPSNPSMEQKADEASVSKGTAIVFNHGIEIE